MSCGTVLSGANNSFVILTDEGTLVRCGLKGKKLKTDERFYNPLAAGDIV